MAAPSPEAAAAAGVTRNQRACATGSSRRRRGLTASCPDGWVLHQDACYRPFNDKELYKLSRLIPYIFYYTIVLYNIKKTILPVNRVA